MASDEEKRWEQISDVYCSLLDEAAKQIRTMRPSISVHYDWRADILTEGEKHLAQFRKDREADREADRAAGL